MDVHSSKIRSLKYQLIFFKMKLTFQESIEKVPFYFFFKIFIDMHRTVPIKYPKSSKFQTNSGKVAFFQNFYKCSRNLCSKKVPEKSQGSEKFHFIYFFYILTRTMNTCKSFGKNLTLLVLSCIISSMNTCKNFEEKKCNGTHWYFFFTQTTMG